jgi:hypothetical protein
VKSRHIIAIAVVVCLTAPLLAQSPQSPRPPLGLKDVPMTAKLLSPISTKTSQQGDKFAAQVLAPDHFKDAVVEGHINSIKTAKKRDKAEISFAFETLTSQARTYPIQADLKEVSNSQGVKNVDEEGRAIGKSSHKKALQSVLVGSAVGGVLGAAMGGGKGAAAGAGAGAAAGLLFAIKFTTSGSDMEFAPGSQFTMLVSDRDTH